MSKIDKIEAKMRIIVLDLIDNLNNEDWNSYSNEDIFEITELLYGPEHPLIAEYDKLDHDLIAEITNNKNERENKDV